MTHARLNALLVKRSKGYLTRNEMDEAIGLLLAELRGAPDSFVELAEKAYFMFASQDPKQREAAEAIRTTIKESLHGPGNRTA